LAEEFVQVTDQLTRLSQAAPDANPTSRIRTSDSCKWLRIKAGS
jgi:hypothetical protein